MKALHLLTTTLLVGSATNSFGQNSPQIGARLSEVTSVFAGLKHRAKPIHESYVRKKIIEGITTSLDYDAHTSNRHIVLSVYEYETVDQAVKATTSPLLRSAPGFIPAQGFNGEMIGDECYHEGSSTKPGWGAHLRIRSGQRVIDYWIESAHQLKGADRSLKKSDFDEMTSNAKKMVEILSKIPLKAAIK